MTRYKKHKNLKNKDKSRKDILNPNSSVWNGLDEVEDWEIVDDIFGDVYECNVFWKLRTRKLRYEALEEKLNFTKSLFSESKENLIPEMC